MPLSAEERAALIDPIPQLNIDPLAGSENMMEVIDHGEAGAATGSEAPDLSAYEKDYGKKVVELAYKRGWRPKEEHRGDATNWLDPADYFDRYAETSDKRAEKKAEQKTEERMAAIEATVEQGLSSLQERVDRVDETDRKATSEHYAQLIVEAENAEEVTKLMAERDEALKQIGINEEAAAKPDDKPLDPVFEVALKDFKGKHPYLFTKETRQDAIDAVWAEGRARELEMKYPNESAEKVFNQISAELKVRRGEVKPETPSNGRSLSDGGGTSLGGAASENDGKLGTADLTQEQRAAGQMLVDRGVFKDMNAYCDKLSSTIEQETA